MVESNDKLNSLQVEEDICGFEALSTIPCISAKILELAVNPDCTGQDIAGLLETCPVLLLNHLEFLKKNKTSLAEQNFSISKSIENHGIGLIKESLLCVKAWEDKKFQSYDDIYKGLLVHSLSMAHGARLIASAIEPKINADMAYAAGLLSNIGKYALLDAMPNSFEKLLNQAKKDNLNDIAIERRLLGTDYLTINKRLGAKFNAPEQIVLALRLYRSENPAIIADMPEARLAFVLQLAYCISRESELGLCCSFDRIGNVEKIAKTLNISVDKVKDIKEKTLEQVKQHCQKYSIISEGFDEKYGRTLQNTAYNCAKNSLKLQREKQEFEFEKSKFDFINNLLSDLENCNTAVEYSEKLARTWQNFYQTGKVCVFLKSQTAINIASAVVLENPQTCKTYFVRIPDDRPFFSDERFKNFAIIEKNLNIDWLLGQIDVRFNNIAIKMAPLVSGNDIYGGILFESRYPASIEKGYDIMSSSSSLSSTLLKVVNQLQKQSHYGEIFANILCRKDESQSQAELKQDAKEIKKEKEAFSPDLLDVLCEISSGLAHELNNPCVVVSARAQLLAESETDPEKKKLLDQISQNSQEVSRIVKDLMHFSTFQPSRKTYSNAEQILNDAILLTSKKTGIENLNVVKEITGDVGDVFCDSGQIASALANIMTNSVESYKDEIEPIKVGLRASDEHIIFEITDSGCGMDSRTASKAIYPFFSDKPAGRKKGLGLSFAYRFVENNGGKMLIESQVDKGTTVKVFIPCFGEPA
ncbi:MAG: HDOD domain-containing protein [Planctomycetes bacterium]|nr:HDOD domain-containing protein [Planctomycetota bacterium]MBL7107259.1 HDOD domain-containing protein [Phycisphaerae bacterium]